MFGSTPNRLASQPNQNPYAVKRIVPAFYSAFHENQYSEGTLASTLTTTGASLKTMVDSDGVLKWGPHNLLAYSEDFSNASWTKPVSGVSQAVITTNAATSPNGQNTANKVDFPAVSGGDFSVVQQSASFLFSKVGSLWLKAASPSDEGKVVSVYGQAQTGQVNIVLTSEWQKATTGTIPSSGGGSFNFATLGGSISGGQDQGAFSALVWGAHLYRSDLGGVVSNPVRGDSYVPTTSAAVYLPRIGHHIFNGAEWVNEGVLVESEARTNLVTYSEDFTNSSWTKINTATLAVDAVGPDGEISAVTFVDNGATGSSDVRKSYSVTVSTSTAYTYSEYFKADQLGWVLMWASGFTTPANGGAYFDLSNGVIGTISSGYTATMESVGNGWYRCSITFTTDSTDTSGELQAYVSDGDGDFTVDRDGTSSILSYGAQFEQAATPSSYIPTAGSTVTRAADTLTIPSANLPWPTPEYIGPELVTNGTFDTDSDWTLGTGWSIADGSLVATSATGIASQVISFTEGKTYQITFKNTVAIQLRIIGGSGQNVGYFGGNVDKIFTVGSGVGSTLEIVANGTVSGSIDNVSVREIKPLAVSIAMEGRVTKDASAAIILNWEANGLNNILVANGLAGFQFRAEESGTVDSLTSGGTDSIEGINVPFSIASRHGSTFINGAVDGTALTADTTPTALPDLSTTDLQIAPDFMGTIKSIRIWAEDIGDDGLIQSTS